MGYSYTPGGFKSHLTGKTYEFTSQTKHSAMAQMLLDDNAVREAAQKRFENAGGQATRKLSDREISEGAYMPDVRRAEERAADTLAKDPKVSHDVYIVAAETIRSKMRSTDSPQTRSANEEVLARLAEKSAAFQAELAARPPVADPNSLGAQAEVMRETAESILASYAGTPAEKAANQTRAQTLLRQAKVLDLRATADAERAVKVEANSAWVIDAEAELFQIAKDESIPQELVNETKAMRERLVNLTATKDDWIPFAMGLAEKRKEIRANKLAAKDSAMATLQAERDAIENPPVTDPPAASEA